MAASLASLRANVRDLAGLKKATATEVDALINEGHKELCVRSEWTRANLSLGPLVAGQVAYTLPSNLERILQVESDGNPLTAANEQMVRQIEQDQLNLRAYGLYWLSFNAAGTVESMSLYPTPGASNAGDSLIATAVVYPATMVEGNSTVVPNAYDRGIRDYVAAQVYGFTEDNMDLREYHEGKFEATVQRLAMLRRSRTGRGGVRVRIEGATA